MRIYRLAKKKFINDLSGDGARLYGGRWNRKGDSMLYFSEHLSMCVLELLVHMDYQFFTQDYYYLEVELDKGEIAPMIFPTSVSPDWRANPPVSATQDFGSEWISTGQELACFIPSAVLPTQRNIIVNPHHRDIGKLKVIRMAPLELDSRLAR